MIQEEWNRRGRAAENSCDPGPLKKMEKKWALQTVPTTTGAQGWVISPTIIIGLSMIRLIIDLRACCWLWYALKPDQRGTVGLHGVVGRSRLISLINAAAFVCMSLPASFFFLSFLIDNRLTLLVETFA
jgi:hypothetical protein